jgi:uncharacterized protein (TIGR02996 family)
MSHDAACHPQLLALLRRCKEAPGEDGPRLVLADWLEDSGDAARAGFIRLQCRLADQPSHEVAAECDQLLNRYGGAWLGSLWRWWPSVLRWHRGLLAVRLPRHVEPGAVADALPWIDTALLQVTGRESLRRAAALLAGAEVNHAHLELRLPMLEATLLEGLSLIPESASLRTLSIDWPLRMLRHRGRVAPALAAQAEPAVSPGFLARLLRCPAGRHLSHLGSSAPFNGRQARLVARLGVGPVHARHPLWMHAYPPARFVAGR